MTRKRFLIFIFLAFGIFTLSAHTAFAANYYVKNGGNDRSDGLSDATAWATIAKVNDFASRNGFSDGDTINFKRGNIWSDGETLGNYDSSTNWGVINGLTIQDYGSGAKPKITGTIKQPIRFNGRGNVKNLTIKNIDVSGTGWCNRSYSGGQIEVKNVNNVIMDGIYCDGHAGTTAWNTVESGLLFDNISGNLEIKNCEIFNLVTKDGPAGYDDDDRHAVVFWSYNPKVEGSVSIHHNLFHHIDADGMQLGAIQVTTEIYNNSINHFGENAIDLKNCKNVVIRNNDLYRGTYAPGGGGTGDIDPAIIVVHEFDKSNWVGAVSLNTEITENYFHDSDYKGIYVNDSKDVNVYQNVFKDIRTAIYSESVNGFSINDNLFTLSSNKAAVGEWGSAMIIGKNAWVDNIQIHGNKIYIDNTTHNYGIVWRAVAGQNGNAITNNIIYLTNNSSNTFPLIIVDIDNSNIFPKIEDNGCFNPNSKNRTSWDGKINYQFPGAVFEDPLFTNPEAGDFKLQIGSPVKSLSSTNISMPSNLGEATGGGNYLPSPKNLRLTIN